jgi:predicted HTH transcriptional regulator
MEFPSTPQDIDHLIATQTQESLHLDYKDSRAIDKSKREEISKDVSAFASSDGGTIIYGVTEKNHLPVARDNGVDHNQFSREWLEQVINSNINPRIDGIQIIPIPVSNYNSIYVVGIPKSFRGPHQAADKKYYKRFNFQSVPMEDYEINDIRSRQNLIPPLIKVATEVKQNVAYLIVENVGNFPARDVNFSFPNGITWRKGRELPNLLKDGAKIIPPSSRYLYLYYVYYIVK